MEWVGVFFFFTLKVLVFGTGMFFAIKWHYDQDKKAKDEGRGSQLPADMRLFGTMLIAIALSMIGIVYAGCWGHAADGGRGGALACAFTLFMLFMSKSTAQAIVSDRLGQTCHTKNDALTEPAPATLSESLDQLARLKMQTEQLRTAFVVRLDSAEREKIYVSIAILISMLAWKFGDMAANWLNIAH